MTKIVVISDSHGNRQDIDGLMPVLSEADLIIHLGDTSGDGGYIRSRFPQKTKVLNGNCDFMKLGEDEITLDIEGVKIFACHGHRYSVKTTLARLAQRAEELGCNIALYGHTHEAAERETGGIKAINPGALPRYGRKSYAYIVIHNGKAVTKIVFADERNL